MGWHQISARAHLRSCEITKNRCPLPAEEQDSGDRRYSKTSIVHNRSSEENRFYIKLRFPVFQLPENPGLFLGSMTQLTYSAHAFLYVLLLLVYQLRIFPFPPVPVLPAAVDAQSTIACALQFVGYAEPLVAVVADGIAGVVNDVGFVVAV